MISVPDFVSIFTSDGADKVVQGNGKYEQLIACSHEIAASTAQLVAASRVKAGRESKTMQSLHTASRKVAESTASVVATAKTGAQMIEEKGEISPIMH